MKINQNELIQDIRRVYDELGKPPSKIQYLSLGKFGVNTIRRRWGSWNNALQEVIGQVNVKEFNPKKKNCPHCQKEFIENFPGQQYCSRTCSNFHKPRRRKKFHKCKSCGELISGTNFFCEACRSKGKHFKCKKLPTEKTIRESLYKDGANKYGLIRGHARSVVKNREQICYHCHYSKHVEVCHIKDIPEFPLDTTLGIVNHPDNLVLLCPNCHWEFDNELLKW